MKLRYEIKINRSSTNQMAQLEIHLMINLGFYTYNFIKKILNNIWLTVWQDDRVKK